MRDDSRQLAGNDAEHRAALGDVYAPETLRAKSKRDIVADRVEIVLTVGPGDDLVVLAVLANFLEPAVQVADVRDAAHDSLALELEHQPQHAVRSGMLRPEVDEHVIG